jgi:hypothetical protein
MRSRWRRRAQVTASRGRSAAPGRAGDGPGRHGKEAVWSSPADPVATGPPRVHRIGPRFALSLLSERLRRAGGSGAYVCRRRGAVDGRKSDDPREPWRKRPARPSDRFRIVREQCAGRTVPVSSRRHRERIRVARTPCRRHWTFNQTLRREQSGSRRSGRGSCDFAVTVARVPCPVFPVLGINA